ncbi:Uncharacterised protein [Brevundimonas diminuta]|uniref:hypothetical protein n=2 Tax=Brevundimonas diminuta TaxID=293 RepID=UPI000B4E72F8|nr:hypothetical protein [Brevundimonas diminuta]OWR22904.1 hypothetical protein CD944_02310 [Brevundimonas diminuta]WQE45216.1 hypothetical protein U0020_16815 [Brevundimonas diminuta]SPU45035.1 Uncharacterised protein [Brevundimonas diminuta]SUW17748.1 Uncharacterised protein [Brevundimonas diminuta]
MRLNLIPASGALTLAAALMACGPAPAEAPAAAPKADDAAAAAPATAAAAAERSADFRRTDPAQADLKLIEEGAEWRVLIRAGGLPNGGATAADCELQARGAQDRDDVIHARLIPFEGEVNELTAADIGADAPVVTVRVGPEGAFVEDSTAANRFCGMGSDISGFYSRTQTPD